MPAATVVIPTAGRRGTLARVLAHLAGQRRLDGTFEIVVVHDAQAADPRGTEAALRGGRHDARLLVSETPGASAARNKGWRAARAPIVLFLDDDIVPASTLLEQHLRWHERNPEETVGVLGRVQWARDVRVTPFMRWLDQGIQFDYGGIRGTEAAWWHLYSCNASLKRSVLERADGFDEAVFPFGYEDLDLGRRLSDHGFRLLYNRDARAEHLRTDSLESFGSRIPRIAQAEAAFVARWPDATPYFRDLFAAALAREPARGRAARFAAVIPPWVPWLGPRVWASADARFKQALAPAYERAWAEVSGAAGGGAA